MLYKDHQVKVGFDITDYKSPIFCPFKQQPTIVLSKYHNLSLYLLCLWFGADIGVRLLFSHCHHSIPHLIIRTVTFCCLFISCLFCFNYSHQSSLMKGAYHSLTLTVRSLFHLHSNAQKELSVWAVMKVFWFTFCVLLWVDCELFQKYGNIAFPV